MDFHPQCGFQFSEESDPEEDALYSKAPDEDTLILSHGGILLSAELLVRKKNISVSP